MASKLLIIISILFLFSACDKVKSTGKKMDGEWTIYSLKVTKYTGLSYYYETTGTITYSDFNGDEGRYALDMTYITPNDTIVKHEKGKIVLKQKGEYYDMYRENSDGTITEILNGRIVLITKNDIKTHYTTNDETFLFILEK